MSRRRRSGAAGMAAAPPVGGTRISAQAKNTIDFMILFAAALRRLHCRISNVLSLFIGGDSGNRPQARLPDTAAPPGAPSPGGE
jgi:hypothetical protein